MSVRVCVRECFSASLTGCHGLRAVAVVVVVVVFVQAEEGRHTGGGAETLSQVGGCWVVGMHAVLRGHVVAGQAAITMRHLLHTEQHKNTQRRNN